MTDDALALADRGFAVPVAGGSTLLAVYSANASAVVLAFAGTNETLVNVTSNNPLEDPTFFKGAFSEQGNGSVDPVLADPFAGRVGSGHEGLYWVRRWLSSHHTRLVCEGASSAVCSSNCSLSEAPHEHVVTRGALPGQLKSACGRSADWQSDCRTAICCRHCRAWLVSSHLPDWSSHDSAEGSPAPSWSLSLQALQVLDADQMYALCVCPISVLIVWVSSAGCEKCDQRGHASKGCVHRLCRGGGAGQAGCGMGRRFLCGRTDQEHQLWGAASWR